MADDGIQVALTTDKPTYSVGEPIAFALRVENASDGPVSLEFMTGQRYDFVIADAAGEAVWRWGAGRGFVQMLGEEQLQPGSTLTYRETYTGQLAPGAYIVTGVLVARNRPLEAQANFAVR